MAKEQLKQAIKEQQEGVCKLSLVPLPEEPELFDTDRIVPKHQGGIYTTDNTRVVDPLAHMRRHNILKYRSPELEHLKSVVDDREQTIKLRNKIDNQIRAYKRRTDRLNEDTLTWLLEMSKLANERKKLQDRRLLQALRQVNSPLKDALESVKAVGYITVAYCLVYLDHYEADYPSSFWKYTGLHAASHERYVKGVAGSGGNKIFRSQLWNMANSQIKLGGPYREVYDRTKLRLSNSKKITRTRNTQGRLVELPWCETKPSHRHGAALRAVMKHFLADYWLVGREILGLPTRPLYVEEKLGHKTIIRPRERGWKWTPSCVVNVGDGYQKEK